MIGTTDVEYRGDPRQVKISVEEKQYLLDVVNKHFIHQVTLDDIVADFSGVRPLCDDESDSPQAITRDYTLSLDQQADNAPLLSIFGGKLTTYRKLAESAMGQLKPFFNQMSDSWTANKPLPGGEAFYPAQLKQQLEQRFPDLDKATINRWITNYGSRASVMLDNVQSSADLGKHFAFGLYQCEVDYLLHYEFASSCEDILWRRSKLGLTFNTEQIDQLNDYIDQSSTCECQRISA